MREPLPFWLRDGLQRPPVTLAPSVSPPPWRGPHGPDLVSLALLLASIAMAQAETLPMPGPVTIIVSTALADTWPDWPDWPDDEGPSADKLADGWSQQFLQELATEAQAPAELAVAAMGAEKLMHVDPGRALEYAPAFLRSHACLFYSFYLLRQALPKAEAHYCARQILARMHAVDLAFWLQHGPGWPWTPLDFTAAELSLARTLNAGIDTRQAAGTA